MRLTKKGLLRELSTYKGVKYSVIEKSDCFEITVNGFNVDCDDESWFFVNSYQEAKSDIKAIINQGTYKKQKDENIY